MGTLSSSASCVINGKVGPLCGVFKDHYNMTAGITLGEACEIQGVILTGRQGAPCREERPENLLSQAGEELSEREVPWADSFIGVRGST